MVRTNVRKETLDGVFYMEMAGLSTDDKPVEKNIASGSLFLELNTGDVYAYNEEGDTGEEWVKICELGGGS